MVTLIVENGTGITDANVYASKAYVDQFCESFGLVEWCNNTHLQDTAMIQAAMFIDLRYSDRISGQALSETQGLAFPRVCNGLSSGIPKNLMNAFAYAAYLYIKNGDLALDANADAGRVVQSESISLGGGAISESKTYATVSANKQITKNIYAMVDSLMKKVPCMSNSAFQIPVYRG